jgi:Xaa-Pro dipeptidase
MLTVEHSRQRQRRLLEAMERRRLDAVVVGWAPHVYYLSAKLPFWLHEAALVLFADGYSRLVWPNAVPDAAAATETVIFEANRLSTLRQEQPALVAERVVEALAGKKVQAVGVEASSVSSQVVMRLGRGAVSIDAELWQLRRRKDADELALMRTAVGCCEAMYARARAMIAPGVAEVDLFAELQAVAVRTAGEPLTALLGNDYACGVPGGPARKDRLARDGEIYILDLGPAYRGYFSDNARSFAVNGKPTDEQFRTWEAVCAALKLVETMAKPGVRCRDLFAAVDEHFKVVLKTGMGHHLGHGVGLQPHEYPHLNPKWDDVLMDGDVFTAEPGQYGPAIAGGIRLENQYLVTTEGVENMVASPLALS